MILSVSRTTSDREKLALSLVSRESPELVEALRFSGVDAHTCLGNDGLLLQRWMRKRAIGEPT